MSQAELEQVLKRGIAGQDLNDAVAQLAPGPREGARNNFHVNSGSTNFTAAPSSPDTKIQVCLCFIIQKKPQTVDSPGVARIYVF